MMEKVMKSKYNLHRDIAMTFRVTEDERELIRQAKKKSGITSMRAYLLKMAVNGIIINIELDSVNELSCFLSGISNNVNQIARRVNQTGNLYCTDIEDIRAYLDRIWESQSNILGCLSGILDGFNTKHPGRVKKHLHNAIRQHNSTSEMCVADGEAGLTENERDADFPNRGLGAVSHQQGAQ